jgi:hypothetical protein
MTDQNITQLIAELDGGKWIYAPVAESPHRFWLDDATYISHTQDFIEWDGVKAIPICWDFCHYKPYLTSRDSIIPVIAKTITEDDWDKFAGALCEINDGQGFSAWDLLCGYNARQLCEALLRATNKWKD